MSDQTSQTPAVQRIVLQQPASSGGKWLVRMLVFMMLGISLFANFLLLGYVVLSVAFSQSGEPDETVPSGTAGLIESFHSGDPRARDKIALIEAHGVLMDDLSEHIINQIKKVQNDDRVKAVVLSIDSPGGLVTDSEQIYHRLTELREGADGHAGKPIVVSMSSLAASGGYYIATAAGPESKFFAEPSSITGSIGVIMPRYDFSKLLEQYHVQVEAITTGPMKDAGSPFRPFDEKERVYWQGLIGQSYDRFLEVVAAARPNLTQEKLKELADGRVYTAKEAKENGLIDAIGYVEEAIEEAKSAAKLRKARVVTFHKEPSIFGRLFSVSGGAAPAVNVDANDLLELATPRAYYIMGPAVPSTLRPRR